MLPLLPSGSDGVHAVAVAQDLVITHGDKNDGFVKSPPASFRYNLRHCGVLYVRLIPQALRASHLNILLCHQKVDDSFAKTRVNANGGERGIRTLGAVSHTHAFQACTFSLSVISPGRGTVPISK